MKGEIEFIDLIDDSTLKPYRRVFKKILKRIKKELNLKEQLGLSVTLCDNGHIRDLNKKYRDKDFPTDVLSFAIEDSDEGILKELSKLTKIREIGDIVISYDKAEAQALEYNHSLNRELCFLFTHGVLHLLGYDHMEKNDEDLMFALQDKILSDLHINR